tara:strand:+ start:14437 stop:14925 length:489 start_codon:yes stop_codon:yes gene_type:complete
MSQLSGTVQQYQGRTIDYLAFDDAKASGDALLSPSLIKPGQSGAITTGIQKLVQRFLLELLTETGSLDYQPGRGCFFITKVRAGLVRTSASLFSVFATAEVDIRNNLRNEDTFSDPDDERYQRATLISASLSGDTAFLNIRVLSVAGESREVIYPLRVSAAI